MSRKWQMSVNFIMQGIFLSLLMLANGELCFNIRQAWAGTQGNIVTIEEQGQEDSPVFYVNNGYHCPVEVEIMLTRAVNIISEPMLPANFVIPAAGRSKVFALKPSQADMSFSYNYQYRFTIGDPKAEHRPPKPYRPPFPNGNRFRISRSFKENSNQEYSNYAVNIIIPEGIPVCAARAGIVIDITSESYIMNTGGGKVEGYTDVLRILHDDGTMGIYAHLKPKSIKASPGENINEKQVIAESGNSGESDISYIHFSVQKNAGMKLVSIPFEFEDKDKKGIIPEAGMILGTD